ncbi:hypothetical protein [Streptomyces sp. NPDC014764]|uniref:hypothetical protein n=1 Tax=Streptomyces sp. NPDC014764 TaxID=3364907 RepID=UPI0036FC7FE5
MAVIGVLREPTPPGEPDKDYGTVGLLIGYMIGSHSPGATDQQPPHPRPGHSTPAPSTPGHQPTEPARS